MTKRRKYTPEFKRDAVSLAQQPGVSCRQIALNIGINPNLLSRWKREAERSSEQVFKGSGFPWYEEVARLKRELAKVKKERDFLRDAARSLPKSYRKVSGQLNVVAKASQFVLCAAV